MRDIKFRGKRIDNGEWVEGNYMEKKDPTKKEDTFWCCFIQDMAISMHQVDPKTVGQYTGLDDKNNQDIYEGDILSYTLFDMNDNDRQCIGVIKWLGTEFIVTQIPDIFSNGEYGLNLCWVCNQDSELEVIGNIYDNPELLE